MLSKQKETFVPPDASFLYASLSTPCGSEIRSVPRFPSRFMPFIHKICINYFIHYFSLSVASALSLFGILLSVGRFLYGNVVDRIGAYRANYFFGGAVIIGQLLCCLACTQQPAILYLAMTSRGLCLPLSIVGYSMRATDFSDAPPIVRRCSASNSFTVPTPWPLKPSRASS